MGLDSWVGVCVAFITIGGGIIVRLKGDYFSRGIGISLLTNISGIIALIVSRPSKARLNDEQDMHGWPRTAYCAVFAEMFLVIILLLIYWLS